jgi:hypothetical protein
MIKAHSEMHAKTTKGQNFASKKAIREALAKDDGTLRFVELGTVANHFQSRPWTVEALVRELGNSGRTLIVVGPDPYTKRSYFGTIGVKDGTLFVK